MKQCRRQVRVGGRQSAVGCRGGSGNRVDQGSLLLLDTEWEFENPVRHKKSPRALPSFGTRGLSAVGMLGRPRAGAMGSAGAVVGRPGE